MNLIKYDSCTILLQKEHYRRANIIISDTSLETDQVGMERVDKLLNKELLHQQTIVNIKWLYKIIFNDFDGDDAAQIINDYIISNDYMDNVYKDGDINTAKSKHDELKKQLHDDQSVINDINNAKNNTNRFVLLAN